MEKRNKKYYTSKKLLPKETVEKHRSDYVVFFTFLIISAFFWLLINLSQEYSLSYNMEVHLQSPPKGKLITKQIDSTITFHITAQGFYLLKLEFMHPDELIVDVKNYTITKTDDNIYYISTQPLKEDIAALLNINPSRIGFSKEAISFYMEKLKSKKVEVVPRLTLKFAEFYNLYKPLTIIPKIVTVYGPTEILDSLQKVYTVPVVLEDIKESMELSVKIDENNDLVKVDPEKIKIKLDVEKFTQSSVVVPVTTADNSKNIQTFPSKVTVFYDVALRDYEKVKSSEFTIVPELKNVDLRKAKKLYLKIVRKPKYVRNVRLEPQQVEFIIIQQ